jgi:cell division protein FtsB
MFRSQRYTSATSQSLQSLPSFNTVFNNKEDLLKSLEDDNLELLKKNINSNTVNDILNKRLGYNALHLAIKYENNNTIPYLLSIGADPFKRTNNGKDAYELSMQFCHRVLLDADINKIKDLNTTNSILEKKIVNLTSNNKILTDGIDKMNSKYAILKEETKNIKCENTKLKSDLSVSNTSNCSIQEKNGLLTNENKKLKSEITILNNDLDSLNNEHKNLKRKYDSLDESYDGLLKKIKR